MRSLLEDTLKLLDTNETPRGQAILVIALTMVVLLGFTGLAIDGGSLYWTQRQARNAVDSAVLASIQEMCSSGTNAAIQAAGEAAAHANGIGNDASSTVTVNIPPTSGPAAGNSDYVEVVVWADAPTYLIQLVYTGPTEVTVTGVGHCRPEKVAFPDLAMVSLCNNGDCDCPADGTLFSGTGNATIIDGGVHSNGGSSPCTATNACAAVSSQGSGNADIDPDFCVSTGCTTSNAGGVNNKNGALTGEICSGGGYVVTDPLASLDPPNDACSLPIQNDSSATLNPGHYSKISGTHFLNPGIYCLDDSPDAVKLTSGDLTGYGVVLYIKNGNFTTVGNGTHNLTAPSWDPADPGYCQTYDTCDWAGMLIWMDASNAGDISMGGGASSFYRGTIYAPSAACHIAGNNYAQALETQFICSTAEVTGTGDIQIQYNSPDIFWIPPQLSVNQ